MVRFIAYLMPLLVSGTLEAGSATISSRHFDIIAQGDLPSASASTIIASLEAAYQPVLDNLRAPDLPRVAVYLYNQKHAFLAAERRAVDKLSEPSAFMVRGPLMSISIFLDDDAAKASRRAVHQFVHLVATVLDADAPDRPRWLWESVALYHANDFVAPHTLSCITFSRIPSLSELDMPANPMIDKLGYLLAEYILLRFGDGSLAALLTGKSLTELTGLSIADFERGWHQFVLNRYLNNQIPPLLSTVQIANDVAGHTFYLDDGRDLYVAKDRTIHLSMGDRRQSGRWYIRGAQDLCWRTLNLPEVCVRFRMNENRYWLDTPSDCGRYILRRKRGNPERY